MADPFMWPWYNLKPRDIVRRLRARTTAGTTSANGFTQRVSLPLQSWVIEYHGILIHTDEQLREWDSVEAALDGGANPVYVPLIGDDYGPPTGTLAFPQSAGSVFATMIRVGQPILSGYHIGFGDGRLHRVFAVTPVGGDVYDAYLRPPLRADYPAGTEINFQTPYCKCRLATDDEMNITITPGRYAVGEVTFTEDPNN